jgi:NitT/TauT family transport system ATP-binding protein
MNAPLRPDYIRIEGLSKTFGGGNDGVLALKDIDCSIQQGSFVTIVGPSGCGKSTLLRILAGLLDYSTGSVMLDGQPIRGTRRDVGVVFQSSILLPWRTILENVMLPAEVLGLDGKRVRERAMQLLQMVRLEGFEHKLPRQLSGGMQQRASIARALLHDPKILLMDEPFGALDEITRDRLNEEILRVWRETGVTILFVTHSIHEAAFLGQRVLMLAANPGRVREIVPVELPRERTLEMRETPEFVRLTSHLRRVLETC